MNDNYETFKSSFPNHIIVVCEGKPIGFLNFKNSEELDIVLTLAKNLYKDFVEQVVKKS